MSSDTFLHKIEKNSSDIIFSFLLKNFGTNKLNSLLFFKTFLNINYFIRKIILLNKNLHFIFIIHHSQL
jgi:hypothetical protein